MKKLEDRGRDRNILKWRLDNYVPQNQISLIDGHDDPLQIQHLKADAVDTITLQGSFPLHLVPRYRNLPQN